MALNAQVTMQIANRDGRSYLAGNYFTPPFKLANITEDRKDPWLHLMLMCSSPGVLDGDTQTIKIILEPASSLRLHTQSYQRLFHMRTGASQDMEVHLGKDARLCYLPHPCVPHLNSIFAGRNRIYLGPGARLIWGEVLTCGRKLTGEVFRFSSYRMRTEVFIADRLALLENISVQPGAMPVNTLGQMAEYTHQASLLFIKEGARQNEDLRGRIAAYLDAHAHGQTVENRESTQPGETRPALLYGLTEGPANSLIVRMLGQAAEDLYAHLQTIQNMINAS